MPTYEYECNNCQHEFELMHSIRDNPKKKCPECKKNALVRLIGAGIAAIVRGTKTPCTGKRGVQKNKNDKLAKAKAEANQAAKDNPAFWRSRDDGKIDMDVLNNPQKYIKTGEK